MVVSALSPTAFSSDDTKQLQISQLSVNMVKLILARVNKVEHGLFKSFRGFSGDLKHHSMEYLRVFSSCLEREQHWYIFYSKVPLLKPSKFCKRVVFESFPDEIRKVRASLLTTEDGQPLSSGAWFKSKYKANLARDLEVYIVTSFGLYIGAVGHKSTLEVSREFDFFRLLLNSFCLDDVRAKTAKMPANCDVARAGVSASLSLDPTLQCPTLTSTALNSLKQQIVQQEKVIDNLKRNLESYHEKIQKLQSQLQGEWSVADDVKSNLMEISENCRLTKKAKNRQLTIRARNIFKELQGVAERHRESLASILGHLACSEKIPEARDLLGEIADMVVEEKGVKKAVKVILSEKVFQTFIKSMVVPDWVLLYFKISARLPDGAWQMLLNLTKLGDTKVSKIFSYYDVTFVYEPVLMELL